MMRINHFFIRLAGLLLIIILTFWGALPAHSAPEPQSKPFSQEQIEQILAPIALYPDSLLTQVLMASTYPLEIVQADRWFKQNKDKKGDALAKVLEVQPWDPSVKSLVNFPQVLAMMSEKLDWTQKLGDAFLAQQKDVMNTVQKLRAKAQASGNLKTTKEHVVKVEKEVIIIEPASPQVIYVPTYNPTVVYGVWAYPAYPPYPVYPPGYVATTAAFSFAAGAAVGAAWGYAWGNANWHGGDVDIDVNKNININNTIDRSKYQNQHQGKGQINQSGKGTWQHDASHRGGVAYRDQGTAQKYNRGTSPDAAKSREAYRGKASQGAPSTQSPGARQGAMNRGGQQNAFAGVDRGGAARRESNRGQASRHSMASAQPMQRGGNLGGFRGAGGRGSRGR
jgi:hypothetical protein